MEKDGKRCQLMWRANGSIFTFAVIKGICFLSLFMYSGSLSHTHTYFVNNINRFKQLGHPFNLEQSTAECHQHRGDKRGHRFTQYSGKV